MTAERIARRLRLWPLYGFALYAFYAWARREINPLHPDAPKVGQRYARLRAEFSKGKTQ